MSILGIAGSAVDGGGVADVADIQVSIIIAGIVITLVINIIVTVMPIFGCLLFPFN